MKRPISFKLYATRPEKMIGGRTYPAQRYLFTGWAFAEDEKGILKQLDEEYSLSLSLTDIKIETSSEQKLFLSNGFPIEEEK